MKYFDPYDVRRPVWEELADRVGYTECSCGSMLQTKQALREHWEKGHMDIPTSELLKGQQRDS